TRELARNAERSPSRRFAFSAFSARIYVNWRRVPALSGLGESAWGPRGTLKVPLGPQDFWPKLSFSLVDRPQKVTRLVSLVTPDAGNGIPRPRKPRARLLSETVSGAWRFCAVPAPSSFIQIVQRRRNAVAHRCAERSSPSPASASVRGPRVTKVERHRSD